LDISRLGRPIVCELGPSKRYCLQRKNNTENTIIRVCGLFVQEIRVAEVRDPNTLFHAFHHHHHHHHVPEGLGVFPVP